MKKLLNKKGVEIPYIGLGTFPFQDREMADILEKAIQIGYRLFDTADDYRGESGIGIAISELENKKTYSREDLFIQTKISDNNAHIDDPLTGIYFNKYSKFMINHSVSEIVREKVSESLKNMKTNYIDSLLIHYPFPDYMVDIWKELIKLKEEGIVRYIGVSNFSKRHIEQIHQQTGVYPEINEIYISPIGIKKDIIDYCNHIDCLVITYSPLMDLSARRIDSTNLIHIAEKHRKSIAQIILRWNIQRGCLPLPKSKNWNRLAENFNVFDFSLSEEESSYISSLNRDYQYLVESKICPGL
jgi:diketogulonate reductase-like aldo/keto reductase